ncbi:juvenile hormone esterase-like [Aphomia sociella]
MATVTISQGTLRGGKSKSESGYEYYEFLGVPYAKPPIGVLRFKNPQSPESWENERDATKAHAENISCHVDFMTGKLLGSEDCLYLNVYTPKLTNVKSELLPVIVHIHGGGFISGNGIIKAENGPDFMLDQDVVVVTINYRLGVFGFLSLDIPEASGNMGLKDQVKALEWVQNNIENFGGDKNNVTLFGISAGSASIDYLILSPLATGLFHKAILRSGSALNHWAINLEIKKLTLMLAKELGYKGSIEDSYEVHEFLSAIPMNQLAGAAFQVSELSVTNRVFFGFVPTVEKDFGNKEAFITDKPYKLFKSGKFNKVPTIRGFVEKEGTVMSMMKPNAVKELIDNKKFVDHWSYCLDSEDTEAYNAEFLSAYLENIDSKDEHSKFATDFFGDMDYISGIWLSNEIMSNEGVPTYLYQFSYDGKLNMFKLIYGMKKKEHCMATTLLTFSLMMV